MEPLVNILTRTSNRPGYFSKNRRSILSQTYKNINHIVCYDDGKDLWYVEKEGYNNKVFIDDKVKIELLRKYAVVKYKIGTRYFLPELYINKMLENVKDGWILVLDDDDTFYDETSLECIIKNIDDDTDMILWKMIWGNGRIIPNRKNFFNIPVLNDIGSPCFMFHSRFKNYFTWDQWSGSDYRSLMRLWKVVQRKKYINEVLIRINVEGMGKKQDLK